jgi:DNA topoisomerase-1
VPASDPDPDPGSDPDATPTREDVDPDAPDDGDGTTDSRPAGDGDPDDAVDAGVDPDGTDAADAGDPRRTVRVFAGDCTTEYEGGGRERTQRGRVAVVVKPDRTTLVHDADGYQPVAWLTRPDALTVEAGRDAGGDGGFGIVARSGDETLRVTCHAEAGRATFPVSDAGVPVGTCPCGGVLVRSRDVVCHDCGDRYPLPSGATVRDATCDCGLPRLRVVRGRVLDVCLDPGHEPLVDAVADAFDRAFDCPDCGAALPVRRAPGRVYLGCETPDCGATFSIRDGPIVGDCDCGLPVFETASGVRCADGDCDRDWTPRE